MINDGYILTPISTGELFDKISVLHVKKKYIKNQDKLLFVNSELDELNLLSETLISEKPELQPLLLDLISINENLWNILDKQRHLEEQGKLDLEFINLSIQVYRENDKRFLVKNKINNLTNSKIKEQKHYNKYESYS